MTRDELVEALIADGVLDDIFDHAYAEGHGHPVAEERNMEADAEHIVDLILAHLGLVTR